MAALAPACPAAASAVPATGPAIGVTPTSALVTATGATAGARVAYGPTTHYGAAAPAADWPDEFLLTGLSPGATYHYRVETPAGVGDDRTVTTTAAGSPELVDRPTAVDSTCTTGAWTSPATVTVSSDGFACRATASSPSGSSYWTSRPAPPRATVQPAVRGDAVLTCDTGQWFAATALDQQWLRDGAAIADETQSSHAVTAADQGHALACQVTATGPGGVASATSPSLIVPAPFTRPAVNAGAASSTPPFPSDGTVSGFADSATDVPVSAVSALRTLLARPLPNRRALLRPDGVRLRFRPPAPLGMLRVKLVSAGTVLAVGARWFVRSQPGAVRLRLTAAGRRALRPGTISLATLVATFVPDRGRRESESRRVVLGF